MSIPVGKGFQPNDGVSIYASKGGNDSHDGTTDEKPVLTVADGLAKAAALISFPTVPLATLHVTSGVYSESLTIPDNVYLQGQNITLTNDVDGETTLKAGNSQFNRSGFLGASGDNATVYEIDGVQRSALEGDTFSLGSFFAASTGITGIAINGVTDDNNFKYVNGICRSTNGKLIDLTGESQTPITVDIGTFTNSGAGFIGLDCNSSDPDQVFNLEFSVFDNFPDTTANAKLHSIADASLTATNVVFVTGTSGQVNVHGRTINALGQTVALVKSGLFVDFSVAQALGNITCESGGVVSFTHLGLMAGNLLLETGATTNHAFIGSIIGDFEVEAGATFNGIVENVSGTVTINGTVNGIINGVHYGTYATGDIEDIDETYTQFVTASQNIENNRQYSVDTTGGPVTLSVTDPDVNAFVVYDQEKNFDDDNCTVIIGLDDFVMDKKEYKYTFVFDGVNWRWFETKFKVKM